MRALWLRWERERSCHPLPIRARRCVPAAPRRSGPYKPESHTAQFHAYLMVYVLQCWCFYYTLCCRAVGNLLSTEWMVISLYDLYGYGKSIYFEQKMTEVLYVIHAPLDEEQVIELCMLDKVGSSQANTFTTHANTESKTVLKNRQAGRLIAING